MTRCLAINSRNDIYVAPDGRLAVAAGIQAVLAACQTAVQAMLGEMPLALDQGMPNFEVIWNGSPNLAQFEAAARTQFLKVPGVIEVSSFTVEVIAGTVVYSATIRTIFGEGQLNGL